MATENVEAKSYFVLIKYKRSKRCFWNREKTCIMLSLWASCGLSFVTIVRGTESVMTRLFFTSYNSHLLQPTYTSQKQPLTHWGRVKHICIITTLLQIMACRLFGAKPLSEAMMPYCQLDTKVHFHSRKYTWKCCLQKGGHLVLASMC